MKQKSQKLINANSFYDEISDIYEQMIDFEKNLHLRINAYKNIFPFPGYTADLGCGVGLDSVALAINQNNVTAFDISEKMVAAAKQNGIKYGVNIETHVSSILSIPKIFNKKFNHIVCVGNTIAHLKGKEMEKAFNRMYKMLLPGGKIFLHIMNYDLIVRNNRRINNISTRDDNVIIRFYDFPEKNIVFNILTFSKNNPKDYKIVSTNHYPHSKNEIFSYLKHVGFSECKASSNFSGEKFDVQKSKDLFIEAWKKL